MKIPSRGDLVWIAWGARNRLRFIAENFYYNYIVFPVEDFTDRFRK